MFHKRPDFAPKDLMKVVVFVVGLLLFLPSLRVGFLLDDFYYLGAIEGHFPDHDTGRSLFTYFINDEVETARIAREGGYPWWIDEGVRSQIFRPLSDLLLKIDHALFGRSPLGYHLHSLVWWTATLVACALLFRRVLPRAVGVLALLLFVLDEAHVMPVAWIANRNALVATAPVLLGLWAWIRWREDGWRMGRALALVGFGMGLAGSELALAGLAYVVAYELLGAPVSGLRSRLVGLVPLAALGGMYVVIYRTLGYGGEGSGLYFHPLLDPVEFVTAAVTRVPTLLASGILGFGADLWFVAPGARPVQVVVGLAGVLVLMGALRVCWPYMASSTRRALRWLVPGSLLSLLPIVATFPSDRMLLVPGLGLAAVIAAVLVAAFESMRERKRRILPAVAGVLGIVHLVLAPLMTIYVQYLLIRQSRESLELAASPVVRDSGNLETVLLFVPDHVVGLYMPLLIDHVGGRAPKSWRPLSIAACDHRLRRTGNRTLELETVDGAMMHGVFEILYRSPKNPLSPGTVIDRGLFRAEIVAAAEDGPTRVAFHFDRDLRDPTLRFLVWRNGELRVAILPALGESVAVERSLGPAGF
jgi:hypothetical protein